MFKEGREGKKRRKIHSSTVALIMTFYPQDTVVAVVLHGQTQTLALPENVGLQLLALVLSAHVYSVKVA